MPSILVRGMGSYTQDDPNRVITDSRWFPNDGVVNTISMRAPAGQPVRNHTSGAPVRGMWNYLGYYNQWDHFDVIGWLFPASTVYRVFNHITSIIYGL